MTYLDHGMLVFDYWDVAMPFTFDLESTLSSNYGDDPDWTTAGINTCDHNDVSEIYDSDDDIAVCVSSYVGLKHELSGGGEASVHGQFYPSKAVAVQWALGNQTLEYPVPPEPE